MKRGQFFDVGHIEIEDLMGKKMIVDGLKKKGVIQFAHDYGKINLSYNSNLTEKKKEGANVGHFFLEYKVKQESPLIKLDITIERLRSNYKNGKSRLFFRCPVMNERSKILYLCDKTHVFVSKEAFRFIDDARSRIGILPLIDNEKIVEFKEARHNEMHQRIEKLQLSNCSS